MKDEEARRDYQRDLMRQRRQAAKQSKEESPPPPGVEPKVAAVTAIKETREVDEVKNSRIDGQVHLLSGSIGVFRSPQVVYDMSLRLLLTQGWCVWRYPTLENETFVVMNGKIPPKSPPPMDLPKLTLNPDREIEIELHRNIPGSMYS